MSDTIFALASAKGKAGVAIIRVSGVRAHESLKLLSGLGNIVSHRAVLVTLRNEVSRETLDQALVLAFKSPHSYTGEDVAEYQVHGSPAIIASLMETLSRQKGHRLAEPGEFTRRAFENGKIDLTEAEAIADLINAETQMQKTQALRQMNGALSHIYEEWRTELSQILAFVEADLEFPDEDLPSGIFPQMIPRIMALATQIKAHLNDNRRGERLRDGIKIAVIGTPNAGKSSLVNVLAQREIAIVSSIAGTTRDIIEAHLDIAGYPVILADTAGLRPDQLGDNAQDSIEIEGIRRALAYAKDADIRVLLYDGTQKQLDTHTYALEKDENTIAVINKSDLNVSLQHPASPLRISVAAGDGIDAFIERLKEEIENLLGSKSDAPALTRQRHREALTDCLNTLERSLSSPLPELAAEDLRLAIRDLGRITGRVDVEDLLDIVFSSFCIGK